MILISTTARVKTESWAAFVSFGNKLIETFCKNIHSIAIHLPI